MDTTETCGVKQAEITVTYRFSPPDQPLPVLLPQQYSAGAVIRIPVEPKTVGDHIRRKRLASKLRQEDVAGQLGVHKTCIRNWESNASMPEVRYMPAIIRFLGYNPMPEGKTWAERLVRRRTSLGLTQREAASKMAVDQGTLAKWERGRGSRKGRFWDARSDSWRRIPQPRSKRAGRDRTWRRETGLEHAKSSLGSWFSGGYLPPALQVHPTFS